MPDYVIWWAEYIPPYGGESLQCSAEFIPSVVRNLFRTTQILVGMNSDFHAALDKIDLFLRQPVQLIHRPVNLPLQCRYLCLRIGAPGGEDAFHEGGDLLIAGTRWDGNLLYVTGTCAKIVTWHFAENMRIKLLSPTGSGVRSGNHPPHIAVAFLHHQAVNMPIISHRYF